MALFLAPDHPNNPPESWQVTKKGDRFALVTKDGTVLDTFERKRDAERHKVEGFYVDMYAKEGRWYAGEAVPGWKNYKPDA